MPAEAAKLDKSWKSVIPAARQMPATILSLHTCSDGDLTIPWRRTVPLSDGCLREFSSIFLSVIFCILCSVP